MITDRITYISTRIILIGALSMGVWYGLWNLNTSIQLSKLTLSLNQYQRSKVADEKLEEFLESVRNFSSSTEFKGQGSELFARSVSLIYERQWKQGITANTVASAYKNALNYNAFNPFLWSTYALYQSKQFGPTEETYFAVKRALSLGTNDYATLRSLIFFTIREWPRLSCDSKAELLPLIDMGLRKNDRLLSRWNYEQGSLPIGPYTTALLDYYGLNEGWAKTQVRVCKQKLV